MDIGVIDPFMPLFAIMECPRMTQSFSTFAIKYFWQILNMIFTFAKFVVVVLLHAMYFLLPLIAS